MLIFYKVSITLFFQLIEWLYVDLWHSSWKLIYSHYKRKKYSLLLIILFNTASLRKIQSFWELGCNPIFLPFITSKFNSPHLCFKGNLIVDEADEFVVWHLHVIFSELKMMNQYWFPLNWTKCEQFMRDQTFSVYSMTT